MEASNPYEVRCPSCRTSFPPETKRCIHCGGRLGITHEDVGLDQDALPFQRGRSLVWVITALLALVLSALRSCPHS